MPMQIPEAAKQMPRASKLSKHLLNLSTEKNLEIFWVVQWEKSGYEKALGVFTMLTSL